MDRPLRGPETVSPPGAMRSKPINTARGTPRDLADLRLYGLQRASSLRGGGVRGSSGTRSVPRALDPFGRSGKTLHHDRRPPRRTNNRGGGALARYCRPANFWLSSSAKADDPVNITLSVITGLPACAGNDGDNDARPPAQHGTRGEGARWNRIEPAQSAAR